MQPGPQVASASAIPVEDMPCPPWTGKVDVAMGSRAYGTSLLGKEPAETPRHMRPGTPGGEAGTTRQSCPCGCESTGGRIGEGSGHRGSSDSARGGAYQGGAARRYVHACSGRVLVSAFQEGAEILIPA